MLARTADLLDLAGAVSVPASKRRTPWEEVRHQARAARATKFLAESDDLLLADLVVAEVVSVLESFYELPRQRVAELVRAIISFPAMVVLDAAMLLRALEVYGIHRLDFAHAYLVAQAERSGVGVVASFDKAIDRVTTIRRLEPA